MTLDEDILPSIEGTTEGCYVGIQFPTGYVGIVNEVSFFLDVYSEADVVDQLFIEASNDNFVNADNIQLLATVSDEVHEGWNYYDLSELETHDYMYFRIRSNATEGNFCDSIGEIHYMGYEVINDENTSHDCAIEHVALSTDSEGVVTETKTDLSATVSYQVDLTPVVDDVLPRWGAVSGGTQITFEGRNYSSLNTADYKVTIDDVDCPVDSVTSTELKCTT